MSVDDSSKPPGNAVTVRGLSPELKARLRVRAAHNARSMEAEARSILEAALSAPDDEGTDLGAFARGLFAPLGGVDLELPARSSAPRHPRLDDATEATETTGEAGDTGEASTAAASPAPAAVVESTPEPVATVVRRRRA